MRVPIFNMHVQTALNLFMWALLIITVTCDVIHVSVTVYSCMLNLACYNNKH